jgi:ribonuclease E
MSAIKRLLKRWGYARLDEFGLVLTADERIVATRPAVLDDGLGARIVGWRDSDLAAIELASWSPPASPPASPMPARPSTTANAQAAAIARPRPALVAPARPAIPEPVPTAGPPVALDRAVAPARPAIPEPVPTAGSPVALDHAVAPAPPAISEPAPVAQPVVVEQVGPPEEDEWEWEIAMARARAAVEWIEEAVAPPAPLAAASSEWLAARPIVELVAVVPAVAHLAPPSEPQLVVPARPSQPGMVPKTVIPVPRLPPAADPRAVARSMPIAQVRFPRSTDHGSRVMSARHVAARR